MSVTYLLVCLSLLVYSDGGILHYELLQDSDAAQVLWLRLHRVPSTWYDARLRCTLEGGLLASPTSPTLTQAMKNRMLSHDLAQGSVHTGIHATFSKGDFTTMEGTPIDNMSLDWKRGEPNNLNNEEDCLEMFSTGEVGDVSCNSTRPYFCIKTNKSYIKSSKQCGTTDDEYKLEATGSCYKFHKVARSWSRANMACMAEGAHLAVINSAQESQILKNMFEKHAMNSLIGVCDRSIAYIGFYGWSEPNEWFTVTGEPLGESGFYTWSPGEPNNVAGKEFCGSIKRDGLYNDMGCDCPLAFICESTPKS